jgi:hypothetical protein
VSKFRMHLEYLFQKFSTPLSRSLSCLCNSRVVTYLVVCMWGGEEALTFHLRSHTRKGLLFQCSENISAGTNSTQLIVIEGYLDDNGLYINRHQTAQSSRRHYHHCPVLPSGTNSLIFVLRRQKIWLTTCTLSTSC